MKKLLFIFFLLAACVEDTEPKVTQAQTDDIAARNGGGVTPLNDPGCRGGSWFQSSNLTSLSPLNYGEWMTIEVKANIPQTGWHSMGPVQIVYRVNNNAGPAVSLSFIGGQNSQYISFPSGGMAAGSYKDVVITVSPYCIALPDPNSNWMIFGFQMKFVKGPGPSSGFVSASIFSAQTTDCVNYPFSCSDPYKHKKATFEQGWSSSISQ